MINHLTIKGKPIPWARRGQGKYGNAYNPKQKQKDAVIWEIKSQYRGKPLQGAVNLVIWFIMPIPKSWSAKKRHESIGEYHIIKPDLDNLEKFYKDAMTGIVYKDDCQVALVTKSKSYGEEPRTEITILEV